MHTSSKFVRAFFGVAAVAAAVIGAQGCVSDRPSRNGVFNENQYVRKDFLVRPATAGMPATDPGWYMKATIVQATSPNPLAPLDLWTGAENSGAIVRFVITQDKLLLADMRETQNSADIDNQQTRTPTYVNAWPVTNVDLKYRVNLDGEKTNFYEENQELDWQVRQWVKINFDKNDLSDIAGLGPLQTAMLNKCTDVVNTSATLVPNSFLVDEQNSYMEFTVTVVAPLDLGGTANSADCMTAYGSAGVDFVRLGRQNVTYNVKYSFARAPAVGSTGYTPFVIAEKDPILHKYGPIMLTNWSRDPNTGLQAANQYVIRYDPNQPIVWYFAQGYPEERKDVWTRPMTGIVDQTNAIFAKAGAKAKLSVLNYNDATMYKDAAGPNRQYGDVRYNFIRWESDLDTDSPFTAVTQFQPDLRTGQIVSASINLADKPLKDSIGQKLQAYLETVLGYNPADPTTDVFADPPKDPTDPMHMKTLPSNCTPGTVIPLVASQLRANIYSQSTLYQRMAQYLPKPLNGDPTPGPSDYVYPHTGDDGAAFYKAYFQLLPYITYADPTMNEYVTPADLGPPPGITNYPNLLHGETLFQQSMSDIDHGLGPLAQNAGDGQQGMVALYNAMDDVRQKWQMHRDYVYKWQKLNHSLARGDTDQLVSFTSVAQHGSRMCNSSGAWEKQAEWLDRLLKNYYELVIWHEFGHVLGMEHNFMASIDKANWPKNSDGTYAKYSSSVMEYSQAWDDVAWQNGGGTTGWLAYDQGAIAFNYGNDLDPMHMGPQPEPMNATFGISGQATPTAPWNDPNGFAADGKTETNFLYCSHPHLRFTPLCRENDVGSTPSEIEAADIESYDWNYKWRNFRNYYKIWDDSTYGGRVADLLGDTRKFLSLDTWDWSYTEIIDKLIRIGIVPPSGASNAGLYYTQLATHFLADVGSAEQLVAALHEAIIQQSTGQRPYLTQFDPYFGDVTQQGIIIDKELALINWLGLWTYDNYDPSQANGYYASSMTIGPEDQGVTGGSEPTQAWSTASSMLGEKGPWDAYPAFFPAAVSLFGHDTQNANFTALGYPQMRDWIGGHSFTREQDALDFFKNLAVKNPHAQIWANDPLANAGNGGNEGCSTFQTCTYNPMLPQVHGLDIGHSNPITQAFIGPDNRRWSWVYLQDRNVWFFTDQDRNPSSYYQIYTYNQDVNTQYDDGNIGPVFSYDAKIKYMIDAYAAFGGSQQNQ